MTTRLYEYKDKAGDAIKVESLDEHGVHVFIANPAGRFSKMVMLPPDELRRLARALDPDTYLERDVWGASLRERIEEVTELRLEIARLRAAAAEVGPDEGAPEPDTRQIAAEIASGRLTLSLTPPLACPECESDDVDNVGDGEQAQCMACEHVWTPGACPVCAPGCTCEDCPECVALAYESDFPEPPAAPLPEPEPADAIDRGEGGPQETLGRLLLALGDMPGPDAVVLDCTAKAAHDAITWALGLAVASLPQPPEHDGEPDDDEQRDHALALLAWAVETASRGRSEADQQRLRWALDWVSDDAHAVAAPQGAGPTPTEVTLVEPRYRHKNSDGDRIEARRYANGDVVLEVGTEDDGRIRLPSVEQRKLAQVLAAPSAPQELHSQHPAVLTGLVRWESDGGEDAREGDWRLTDAGAEMLRLHDASRWAPSAPQGGPARMLDAEQEHDIIEWASEMGCEMEADDEEDYDPKVCSKHHTGRCWPCSARVLLEPAASPPHGEQAEIEPEDKATSEPALLAGVDVEASVLAGAALSYACAVDESDDDSGTSEATRRTWAALVEAAKAFAGSRATRSPAYVPKVGDIVVVDEWYPILGLSPPPVGAIGKVTGESNDSNLCIVDGWWAKRVHPTSDEPGEVKP